MPTTARTSSTGTLWPRFSKYEIVDGSIRPTRASTVEWYDPYEEFEALSNRSATRNAAYEELISLSKTFAPKAPSADHIATAKAAVSAGRRPQVVSWAFHAGNLLEWVRQHGLLGLLHHALVSASFWKNGVEQATLHWSRAGWQLTKFETHERGANLIAFWQQLGYVTASHAVVRTGSATRVLSPPEPAWATYFPTIAHKDILTVPRLLAAGNERAWRQYAEPVNDFVLAALSVKTMLTSLLPTRTPNARSLVGMGLFSSDELLVPVRSGIHVGTDGGFRSGWSSPSLLGHLAVAATHDIARQQRIVTCENPKCGTPFATATAKYCSERCRDNVQMRRRRERIKSPITPETAAVAPPGRTKNKK